MTRVVLRSVTVAALLVALLTAATTAARAVCPGDCDGSGDVGISELVKGVNMALGASPPTDCPAFDSNGDGMVSVSELIAAVNAALGGCPAESPTATATSTATGVAPTLTATPAATPTATLSIDPIFPADYRDSFIEVRDCRLGIEHGGVMIRVLANAIGAEPYKRLQNPLPVGSIVVKEEYDGVACDDADLVRWSAMRKEAPGFDTVDGDWHWQRVDAPSRHVACDDKGCPAFPCIGCHRMPACVARDYMCTVDDTPRGTLKPVLENLPAALLSISGRAPKDVYAVGGDPGDGRGSLVLHYDGSGWRRLDTGATGALWWISVTPIDGKFYMSGEGGLILEFDPSSGQFMRPTTPDSTSTVFGIWGTAATNLYAVGGDDQNHALVWHSDGATWSVQDVSALVPGDEPTTLYKVWGTAANDVYAVGETGLILHYDGMSWSRFTSPVTNTLFTIHGAGSRLAAVGGFQLTGVLLERNGSDPFSLHTPSGTPRLNGVFVPPNGNAVAVGVSLAVAARDDAGWTLVNSGTDDLARDFHAVWIDSEDGIWAVGGDLGFLTNGLVAYGGPQVVPGGPVQ